MINLGSSLKLLSVDNIKMHESFQQIRLEKTMSAILKDKVLINPIIITKINENNHMIIDGVHRFLSLKELGFKTVACQIVKEEDIKLSMWSHLVKAGEWLKDFEDENVIRTEKEFTDKKYAFKITDSKQESLYFYLNDDGNLKDYVNVMHNVVEKYNCKHFIRICEKRKSEIDEEDVLVEFCEFNMKQINNLFFTEVQLPTGVTHFSINNRLLNLKIPLEYMEPNICEQTWRDFVLSIQQKLRYYPEPVYFCE